MQKVSLTFIRPQTQVPVSTKMLLFAIITTPFYGTILPGIFPFVKYILAPGAPGAGRGAWRHPLGGGGLFQCGRHGGLHFRQRHAGQEVRMAADIAGVELEPVRGAAPLGLRHQSVGHAFLRVE